MNQILKKQKSLIDMRMLAIHCRIGIFHISLFLLAVPFIGVQADIITLRSGRKIEGSIISQNRSSVRVRVRGRIRTFRKRSISRIRFGETRQEKAAAARILRQKKQARKIRDTNRKRATLERLRRKEIARKLAITRRKQKFLQMQADLQKLEDQEQALRRKREELLRKIREARESAARREAKGNKKESSTGKNTAFAKKMEKKAAVAGKTGGGMFSGTLGSQGGAALRSAILPGWSQYRRGERGMGAAYLGGSIYLLGSLFAARANHGAALNDYNTSSPISFLAFSGDATSQTLGGATAFAAQTSSRQATLQARRYSTASLFFIALYFWNIYDAFSGAATAGSSSGGSSTAMQLSKSERFSGISFHITADSVSVPRRRTSAFSLPGSLQSYGRGGNRAYVLQAAFRF